MERAVLEVAGSDLEGAVAAELDRALEARRSRLRRLRESAGLSQAEVAEALGVSQRSVSSWEAANDVPEDKWPVLAGVLGVRESYPAAPFNPERRRAWFDGRNGWLRARPPGSGVFGKGKAGDAV